MSYGQLCASLTRLLVVMCYEQIFRSPRGRHELLRQLARFFSFLRTENVKILWNGLKYYSYLCYTMRIGVEDHSEMWFEECALS